ncbi:MAG: sulfatase-like hydrolase/transferase [Cyclobacteriaceae bacterium]
MYRLLFLSTLLVCSLATCWAQKSTKKKPNVLVIYTDDHRYTGIHALGGQAVKTPNMDQLANEGLIFTKTYLQGAFSGATCIPSRAMLLTGRSVFDLQGVGHTIPAEHTMIGETFSAAGYHSHIEGKWHQDTQSLARGFDTGGLIMGKPVYLVDHFRMPFSEWNSQGSYPKKNAFLLKWDENGDVVRKSIGPDDKRGPFGTEENGPHTSEVIADGAISFLEAFKKDNPFFMYVAFHAPHDPRQAPKAYKAMYPEKEVELPPSYLPQHPFEKADLLVRDEALAVWPRTPEVSKKELSDYYAIITHLDDQIGRVIKALKEKGMYENTIIVLAGDSGLAVGNHGLMGKQNIYDEDGIHVPFIISGGLIKDKGRRLDPLSYTHDIYPTICDLAGVEVPASVKGKSLLPVIDGEKSQVRDYTYHAYKQYERAIRVGNYKLIEYVRAKEENRTGEVSEVGSRVTQLFNLANDPWEIHDLSWYEEYDETVKELRRELRVRASEEGDDADGILGQKFDFWDFY